MKYNGLIFKNRKFDLEKLQKFGFELSNNDYIYKAEIADGSFELLIRIKPDETIDVKIFEVATQEEYNLIFIKSAQGKFIGKIREEYENILNEIKDKCTFFSAFQSKYANLVIEYIKEKYNNEAQYLWKKFPDICVFKRNDKKDKWYAVLLTVAKNKIGLEGSDKIEIINLKSEPEMIEKLVDSKRYFKAYHMNKKHWFTICLDGSVDINEIKDRIDTSYNAL